MSRLYGQAMQAVLDSTLAISACTARSGSAISAGYARLIGTLYSNASADAGTGSGLHIEQSADYGAHWDVTTASYTITASAASAFDVAVTGNAVQVKLWNGCTTASLLRAWFALRPV